MTDPSGTPRQPPPAAWYRDRSDPSLIRYWDGTRWTKHTHPASNQAPSPPTTQGPAEKTASHSAVPRAAVAASYFTSGSFSLPDADNSARVRVNPGASGSGPQPETADADAATTTTLPDSPEVAAHVDGDQSIGISAELRDLASLRDDGTLTAEEFEAEKQNLLQRTRATPVPESATMLSIDDRPSTVAAVESAPQALADTKWPWWRERRTQVGLLIGVGLLVVGAGVTFSGGGGMRSTATFCTASTGLAELGDNATEAQVVAALDVMAASAPSEIAGDVAALRDFDLESLTYPSIDGDMMADEIAEWRQESDRAAAAADELEALRTRVRTYFEENCDAPEEG